MKIGPNPSDVNNLAGSRSAQPVSTPAPTPKSDAASQAQAQAQVATAGGTPTVGVPVSVSRLAQTLAASQTTSADPTFDAEKVQTVRDAIANGTYQSDAGAIADGLLADAESFLRVQREQ